MHRLTMRWLIYMQTHLCIDLSMYRLTMRWLIYMPTHYVWTCLCIDKSLLQTHNSCSQRLQRSIIHCNGILPISYFYSLINSQFPFGKKGAAWTCIKLSNHVGNNSSKKSISLRSYLARRLRDHWYTVRLSSGTDLISNGIHPLPPDGITFRATTEIWLGNSLAKSCASSNSKTLKLN